MSRETDELYDPAPETALPPEERYGRRRDPGVTRKIVLLLLVLLLIAMVFYAWRKYQNLGSSDIEGFDAGFSVIDDEWIELKLDVTRKNPQEPAYCIVKALDYAKAEVGRREVYVAPSDEKTVSLSVPINTRKKAAAATVYGCGSDIPGYLERTPVAG